MSKKCAVVANLSRLNALYNFNAIFETFVLPGDQEAGSQCLVELVEQMDSLPAAGKTEATRLKDCMSTVYVVSYRDDIKPDLVQYRGHGNAPLYVTSGKTTRRILEPDIDRHSQACIWRSTCASQELISHAIKPPTAHNDDVALV